MSVSLAAFSKRQPKAFRQIAPRYLEGVPATLRESEFEHPDPRVTPSRWHMGSRQMRHTELEDLDHAHGLSPGGRCEVGKALWYKFVVHLLLAQLDAC